MNSELAHFITFMNNDMTFLSFDRVFQIKLGRENPPTRPRKILLGERAKIFLYGGWNLTISDFDHLNLVQS